MKRIALQMVAVIVALSVSLAPVAWAAEQNSNPNPAADLGLGVASFICSVPYGAIKVAVAILGGVIGGGFGCPLGGRQRERGWGVGARHGGEEHQGAGHPAPVREGR